MYITSYSFYKQLFVILLALGRSRMEIDDHFRPILERALEKLCPYNAICRAKAPRLVSNNSEFAGCCSDCSCDESCGLTENCCLPEMDIHHVVDRTQQVCLKSSTNQNISLEFMSFNMVVDSYPDGQGDDCSDRLTPCGEDELASPIGAFYPVFSNKTGRIYKNIKCARCHGLKEEDVIKWEVFLQCDNIISEGIIHVDVSAAFNSLEKSQPAQNCHYVFYYPGPSSDIKYEKCIGDYKHRCKDEFYVDSRLNMTKEEIEYTCFSGLKSAIYDTFINTFCNICGNIVYDVNIIDSPLLCRKEKDTGSKTIPDSDFTALIYPEDFEAKPGDHHEMRDDKKNLACSRGYLLNKNQTTEYCRTILCPTGRLRRYDGTCVFPIKSLNNNLFTLTVELTPMSLILVSDLTSPEIDYISVFVKGSPWPSAWKIRTIVYKSRDVSHSKSVVEYFLIFMQFTKPNMDIAKVLSSIDHTLALPWLVKINNVLITHTQAHSKYTRMHKVNKDTVSPVFSLVSQFFFPPHLNNSANNILNILVYDGAGMAGLSISKTFFCEQIELKDGEFEMYMKIGIFYHRLLKRTFFRGEFAYVYGDHGEAIPRICLEDSRFRPEHLFTNSKAKHGAESLTSAVYFFLHACVYLLMFCFA